MPTYDYRCGACNHQFEHFQAISDPLLRKCPECGKQELERLIGAGAGFLFKGAGFYITDYRSDSYQAAAKKESGASGEKSTEKSAEKSGEKPASTTSDKGGEKSSGKSGEKTAAPAPTSAKPSKPAPTKGKSSKSR